MESSSILQEIDAKAKERKLFKTFDNESIDMYIRMMLTMKTQVDSLNENQEKSQKDLAILYKRFSYNSQDIINHLTGDFTSSSCERSKKIEFLKKQIGLADQSIEQLVMSLSQSSQPQIIPLVQQETGSNENKNAFSYSFDPNQNKQLSQPQKQESNPNLYPVFGVGMAVGGTALAAGTGIASTTTSLSSGGMSYPALSSFSNTLPSSSTNLLQSNQYPGLSQSFQQPNQLSTSMSYPQHNPQVTNFVQQPQYNQSFNSTGQFGQQPQLHNGYNYTFQQQQQLPPQNFNQSFQQPPQYGQNYNPNYANQSFYQTQQYPQQNGQFNQTMSNQSNFSRQSTVSSIQQNPNNQQYQQNQYPPQQNQPITLSPDAGSNVQQQPKVVQSNQITLKNLNLKGQLRTIYCPYEIIEAFIAIAQSNTLRKLETCAILAGSERNDALIIDTLIVPTQEGHTDHCFMTDEIQLFEAQMAHKVMTLGWIHTHPQYSLFLSSVDVHNQMGYQLQMPEAVAIVYSPIESARYKTFRVKDSRVPEIQKCTRSGFHEHKDQYGQPAFEECSHIRYIKATENNIRVKTVDLR